MKKNRLIMLAGLAVLVAAGLLIAACDNGTQSVSGAVYNLTRQLAEPLNVTATVKDISFGVGVTAKYVIVTWDAPENVRTYEMAIKEEGKNSIDNAGYGQNDYLNGGVGSSPTLNTDPDEWSAAYNVSSLTSGKKYLFGVRSSNAIDYGQSGWGPSDFVWSEVITAP